ncbi:MAG: hypothetical protein WCA99_12360 [Candidatus Sulfotelmatobacter sp.]
MIIVRLLSPEPVGWIQHHQLYSGTGADIVMESITLIINADVCEIGRLGKMIAPSKLGRLVSQEWPSDDALLLKLRRLGLVKREVSDEDLKGTFIRARQEDSALPPSLRQFNSPNERVRVFLGPFLSRKGTRWAVPLLSLEPWWKFWH